MRSVRDSFDLTGRVAIITGGSGFLGVKHAEAVAEMGGIPAIWDLDVKRGVQIATEIKNSHGGNAYCFSCNVAVPEAVSQALSQTLHATGRVDILINNAANNPKVEGGITGTHWSRLENYSLESWQKDLMVGLTGAFLCCQIVGTHMARQGRGVILNVASDLALIAPDQRIYQQPGIPLELQPAKPVSYSVVKSGLVGLTRYLATYWADCGVRVNAISPGGVFAGQDADFVRRLVKLIPLQRMAEEDEYKAAVVFLVSDASSYMTGANLVIDGGRTCW